MRKRIIALFLASVLLLSMAACKEKEKDKADERQPDGGQTISSQTTVPVFWNIDRDLYFDPETQMSTRQPAADGLYHIRFLINGTQITLSCSNRALIDRIDAQQYMGLILHGSQIMEVLDPSDICFILADGLYVERIDGNTYTARLSVAMNYYCDIEITEETRIYDVNPDAEIYGVPTELGIMDRVTVLMDKDAEIVTHVFITQRFEPLPLFWRVDETYGQVDTWDAENKCTTRVPDENGVYTIRMAKDGQQVDVLCKDIEIVNKIDSMPLGEQVLGLRFDDEGFADHWGTAAKSIRGTLQANQWDVTELRDDGITATRTLPGSTQGAIWEGKFADDCRIYDTTGSSGYVGIEVDTLQLGDRVMVLCNVDGKIQFIYITNRPAEN